MMQIPVYDGPLFHGYAVVDNSDYYALSRWLWKLNKGIYACRYDKAGGTIYMHREVLGLLPGDGFDADHINGDGLDNQRANLRVVSRKLNIQNRQTGNRGARSAYRGVSLCKQTGRWTATVTIDRHCHWLGRHDTEEQAAAAAAAFRARHMPGAKEFVESEQAKETG